MLLFLLGAACLIMGILLLTRDLDNNSAHSAEAGTVVFAPGREEAVDYGILIQYDGGWYKAKEGLTTALVMGLDKFTDEAPEGVQGSYEQADFLMLMVSDPSTETYTAIHINRDSMVEFWLRTNSGTKVRKYFGQIALSHSYGGSSKYQCENTVEAATDLLDGLVEIDHYISITMDGVMELNDYIGGVTLEVMEDFAGDDTLVKGETVTLRGIHALHYVRQRMGVGDETNLSRMQRQRQYIQAFQQQLFSHAAQDSNFILAALLTVNDYLYSDCTINQLSDLFNAAQSYDSRLEVLPGEAESGETFVEFYVDEAGMEELVMDVFYDRVADV